MSSEYIYRDGVRVYAGPEYTITSPAIQKYRRAARKGGLSSMSKVERWAYGEAVEKAVLAAQLAALRREKPGHMPNCASGTWHNTGEAIDKAIKAKQLASLLACKSRIATMEAHKVRELYDEAMAAKRARLEEERCKKPPAKSPMKRTVKPSRTTTMARRASAGINSAKSNKLRGTETRRRAGA